MTFGDPSNWDDFFQQDLVPAILSYVFTTWEQMPKPGVSDLEDEISDKLFVALVKATRRSDIPFLIRREDLEFDMDLAAETGRKDIVFYPSLREQDVYLCIEAKRLNAFVSGKRSSLASEYVKEGMQRFVDGKYARHVKHGAMLGYVLDGDIERAIRNLQNNIIERQVELRLSNKAGLLASKIRPADERTKETHHERGFEDTIFRIHHLFVAG